MSSLDSIPLFLIGFGIIFALSLIIELGYRIGRLLGSETGLSKHPVEASVTTAILSLMAFMLGFTFATAASRAAKRASIILADNNTAGTLYLRADLLPPEMGKAARDLIRQYVEIRSNFVKERSVERIVPTIEQSARIQTELWELTMPHHSLAAPSLVSRTSRLILKGFSIRDPSKDPFNISTLVSGCDLPAPNLLSKLLRRFGTTASRPPLQEAPFWTKRSMGIVCRTVSNPAALPDSSQVTDSLLLSGKIRSNLAVLVRWHSWCKCCAPQSFQFDQRFFLVA